MAERIFQIEDLSVVAEYMTYGGIEFPRYLVTRETFEKKLKKVREIMGGIDEELAKGTPTGDAGDTHGQYHNELAWYREQGLSRRTDLAKRIGRGLDRAIVIEDYDQVRDKVREIKQDVGGEITLASVVNIQHGDDPDDVEEIRLVAPLDGGMNKGYVSVETPLARAIEGKKSGDVEEFEIEDRIMKVKIL